ncbi:Aldo/keto reductase [Halobellus clavatus]|jgi:diketogulonate reductase-like aldo/keto reductase|uniref:Aldo/keto reductase n=2 Tax=Halobellus clavatus TaxID=660517 RepID=A0A1H3D7F9_9EURY|nr:aldo/keto reductase [Halobellus clavatus]SDX62068.1 Aldo/keto reductase [Halobellus clavatus]
MAEMEYAEAYGTRVPKIGLGTWQLTGEACYEAVSTALELGYRHIDTAQLYENEAEVGRAVADADVDREELFVTTKLKPGNARYDDVLDSTEASLDRLGTDYVDLLLLHWPNPLVSIGDTMDAMDRLVEDGRVANIGVSNFPQILLERARDAADADVLTNQVQFHPYKPQRGMLGHCQEEGMLLTGYSPLARGTVFDDADVQRIAESYDRTPAQVALRWATQHRNVVVIPKSADPTHLEQNLEIFDFKLTSAEVDALTKPSLLKSGAAMLDGMVSELRS